MKMKIVNQKGDKNKPIQQKQNKSYFNRIKLVPT